MTKRDGTYSGPVTVVAPSGIEAKAHAKLERHQAVAVDADDTNGGDSGWGGRLSRLAVDWFSMFGDSGTIRLPHGKTGDFVVVQNEGTHHLRIAGTGPPPF